MTETGPDNLNDLGSPLLSQLEETLRLQGQGFPGHAEPEVEARAFFRRCLAWLGVPSGSAAVVVFDEQASASGLSWLGNESGSPIPVLTVSEGMHHPVTMMHAAALASVTGGAEGGRLPQAADGPSLVEALSFLVEKEHTWAHTNVTDVQAGLRLMPVAGQRRPSPAGGRRP